MLITLAVSGYRSLRNISLPLERLNVITGPNGSGKSSLYRAIQLLVSASQGSVTNALANVTEVDYAIACSARVGFEGVPIHYTSIKVRILHKRGRLSFDSQN